LQSAKLTRVNVHDELELRDVLFGEGDSGKSYAVLCQEEQSTLPISSVFTDAFKDGTSPAHFRVVDCNYVLPSSGKSIAERFELDLKVRPTIFISGAGMEKPQQVSAKYLKTGGMLVKLLKQKLVSHAAKIETTQDLRTKCLDKDICALLLKGSKKAPKYLKDAMQKLLVEFPTVAFAVVNSEVLYLKNGEEHLPELVGEEPRFVVFKKVSGSAAAGGSRLITSIAPLETGVSYGTMSTHVAGVVRKTIAATRIPSVPTISIRTKKLVEEEKAKRQRKKDRAQESSKTAGGASTSNAQANDGTRDGRRLEREKRRAQHRANNNVRERTPEEIADIERKRRIRMEEQASKWNVASPEDGFDNAGGLPFEDEDFDDMLYLEEDEKRTTTVADEDQGDGEDVIDLD
jgi:hypothetical protein